MAVTQTKHFGHDTCSIKIAFAVGMYWGTESVLTC